MTRLDFMAIAFIIGTLGVGFVLIRTLTVLMSWLMVVVQP